MSTARDRRQTCVDLTADADRCVGLQTNKKEIALEGDLFLNK
jgi:hypothetical protein